MRAQADSLRYNYPANPDSDNGKHPMSDSVTLYVLQYQLKRNLRPFTREEILQLPTGRSGVYVLWRKTGTEGRNECLYVGESTTCVRRRLLQHHSNAQNDGLHSQLRMFRSIVQFSVEFTEDAEETVLIRIRTHPRVETEDQPENEPRQTLIRYSNPNAKTGCVKFLAFTVPFSKNTDTNS